jgi:hypothetical protein
MDGTTDKRFKEKVAIGLWQTSGSAQFVSGTIAAFLLLKKLLPSVSAVGVVAIDYKSTALNNQLNISPSLHLPLH